MISEIWNNIFFIILKHLNAPEENNNCHCQAPSFCAGFQLQLRLFLQAFWWWYYITEFFAKLHLLFLKMLSKNHTGIKLWEKGNCAKVILKLGVVGMSVQFVCVEALSKHFEHLFSKSFQLAFKIYLMSKKT